MVFMMATVKEDISCVCIRSIGKNVDISDSRIEALIGTEGELASINWAYKTKDRANWNNHLKEVIKKEVMPNDKIPDRTIGYIITHECNCGHSFTTYVLRNHVYNKLTLYEYLVNMQGGYELWN